MRGYTALLGYEPLIVRWLCCTCQSGIPAHLRLYALLWHLQSPKMALVGESIWGYKTLVFTVSLQSTLVCRYQQRLHTIGIDSVCEGILRSHTVNEHTICRV